MHWNIISNIETAAKLEYWIVCSYTLVFIIWTLIRTSWGSHEIQVLDCCLDILIQQWSLMQWAWVFVFPVHSSFISKCLSVWLSWIQKWTQGRRMYSETEGRTSKRLCVRNKSGEFNSNIDDVKDYSRILAEQGSL